MGPGSELTPADVDGDGDADLVVYEVTGALRWVENQGGGAFGGPTLISDEVEVIGPLRCADLDGDGSLHSASMLDACHKLFSAVAFLESRQASPRRCCPPHADPPTLQHR